MTRIIQHSYVHLLPLGILVMSSMAQAVDEDFGLWATGSFQKSIDESWSAGLAIQPRFNQDLEKLERLVIRPTLSYRSSANTSLTLGYDAHFIESPKDKIEHRTWQQIAAKHAGNKISTFAHARLEQRYLESVSGVAVRLRLKAGAKIPLDAAGRYGILSNEVFFGLNDLSSGPNDGFDQNRLFIGVGAPLSPRISGELGYQMQLINRPREDAMLHQIFISLSFK